MPDTTTVRITVEVPTTWWDYLVEHTGSEANARNQILRAGGVSPQWRDVVLRHEQERTGALMNLQGVDDAHEAEIARLKAMPDKPKPAAATGPDPE